ncbi:MAG: phosphodiesterase [Burkholderiaceae bacterium]|nr:phosphodiesterase [Burkholderiaceae bacterium]
MMTNPALCIAQITDPHIRAENRLAYNRVDTTAGLRRTVAEVLSLPQAPNAVVMTGDLVDFGQPAEYARLREVIAPLPMPVYLLPGNHDDRDALRAAFPDHAYLGGGVPVDDGGSFAIQYRVAIGPLQLIALDTVVPRESHGALCSRRLDWLTAQLDECVGQPVVIAMHHPPFTTFISHMDAIGLLSGSDTLAAIVARFPNVERVICGHLHRAIETRFGGTIAATSPAPSHQVTLDLTADAASTFTMEPPAFRIYAWAPGKGVVSHLMPVGRFDGPHPFHEASGKLID